ncbi:MAG: hypothetical protein ACYTEZ_01185 [Planctomycetota bacterium]
MPELDPRHLLALSDDTGVIQHAIYATPNRRTGYTTDDKARAALVAAALWARRRDAALLRCLQTCLAALRDAQPAPGTRFRNVFSFDRRWCDTGGSDDCQGRALWALGYVAAHPPTESVRLAAEELFRTALPVLATLRHARGRALAIVGLAEFLGAYPDDGEAQEGLAGLAADLEGQFAAHAAPDWPWFEDIVTYDNGRLPQALLRAGRALGDEALVRRGLDLLAWLLEVQSAPAGHLSVIGNRGWLRRGGERARFDQQPLEAGALVVACRAALDATGAEVWREEMRRCFDWYQGRNDHGLDLIDPETGGCRDGLTPEGLNLNQGAESTVAWLEALLEMQRLAEET